MRPEVLRLCAAFEDFLQEAFEEGFTLLDNRTEQHDEEDGSFRLLIGVHFLFVETDDAEVSEMQSSDPTDAP